MRGLTPKEEEALSIVAKHQTDADRCRYCRDDGANDYVIDDDVVARLVERGLMKMDPCDVSLGAFHAEVTAEGRMVLALVVLARAS